MKKLFLKSVLVVSLIAPASQAFSWGTTGHRVIAEIAERNLTDKAKAGISELIGDQHLAYFANWADEIRSDTTATWKNTPKLHYVDFPKNMTEQQVKDKLDNYGEPTAYSAILECEQKLEDPNMSKHNKVIALKFLVHFIGDVSQPMHVGHPKDYGGNTIRLKWFYSDTNLHALWDTKMIDFQKYSYTEYADILNRFGDKDSMATGDLKDWIWDSYTKSSYLYKDIKNYGKLDFKYMFCHKDLLEHQLLKGGMRLAKVLNDIFK